MTRLRNLKFSSLLLILITPFSYAQTMTYEQVLQRVVDYMMYLCLAYLPIRLILAAVCHDKLKLAVHCHFPLVLIVMMPIAVSVQACPTRQPEPVWM